jgi:hypothetical protein
MMPHAFAQTTATITHETTAAMNMSPLAPQSKDHCKDCTDLQPPSPMSADCAGHCLTHSNEQAENILNSIFLTLSNVLFPNTNFALVIAKDTQKIGVQVSEPPGNLISTRTIVLRE